MRNDYSKIKVECTATGSQLKNMPDGYCLYLAGDGLCLKRWWECSFQKKVKKSESDKLLDSPETK
jgi:hypothetical protein